MVVRYAAMAALAPIVIAAAATNLAGYAGKYPFDKVGGTSFSGNPAVRQQIVRHAPVVLHKTLLSGNVVASPIGRQGHLLAAGMCEPHNCGLHNWTVLISTDGTRAAICHTDQEVAAQGIWYQNRAKIATQDDGACPNAPGLVPAAVLARFSGRAAAPAGTGVRAGTVSAADRAAMLNALRPAIEQELGSPVQFVVRQISVSGQFGFALLDPVRPGGARVNGDATPLAVRHISHNGDLRNFSCCETTALFRRQGAGWGVLEYRVGASDAWYEAWKGRVPADLFTAN